MWQQIGPKGPMHLNFVLTPVNASSIISRKLKWVGKDVKNVNSRKRHGWARITDPSFARIAAAGGGSTAIRAIAT